MRFALECREIVASDWEKILTHPFLVELAHGVLPREKFDYYLSQDDYYLQDLLSVLGILVAKSRGGVKNFAIHLLHDTLQGEVAMHEAIAREGGTKSFPELKWLPFMGIFCSALPMRETPWISLSPYVPVSGVTGRLENGSFLR